MGSLRLIARAVLICSVLLAGGSALAVAAADLIVNCVILIVLIRFVFGPMRLRMAMRGLDWGFARQSVVFGFALALSSVSIQVNMSIDKVVVGALLDTSAVAVYSVALSLYAAFAMVTLAIGSVFLPEAVRLVHAGAARADLTQFVVRPGRLQLIVGGCLLGGFLLFGRDFLALWVGVGFLEAWAPVVILIIPNLVVSVQSVAIGILDAKLKRIVRLTVVLAGAAFNLALTFVLVPRLGVGGGCGDGH